MKNRMKRVFSAGLALLMVLGLFCAAQDGFTVSAAGDDGTVNRDFAVPVTHLKSAPSGYTAISTAAQLDAVRTEPGKNYILMANIDLSAWGNWQPIGTAYASSFQGIFDGNGYVIKNMTVNVSSAAKEVYAGLFGYCFGSVKNLGISGGSVSAASSSSAQLSIVRAGGIAGDAVSSSAEIENCFNTAKVSASASGFYAHAYAGGVAGYTKAALLNCYNTGDVSIPSSASPASVGGITGHAAASVSDCYNTGKVNAAAASVDAGGILGYTGASVTGCHNTGAVSVSASVEPASAGGIAGYAVSNVTGACVTACYNTGDISASELSPSAGGITGFSVSPISGCYNTGVITASHTASSAGAAACAGGITGEMGFNTPLSNCYNAGSVNAANSSLAAANAGGIAGELSSTTISKCYNIAAVHAASQKAEAAYAGGISGYSFPSGTMTDCYYIDSNAVACAGGNRTLNRVLALNRGQVGQQTAFAGFDFSTVWLMSGSGYPHLRGLAQTAIHLHTPGEWKTVTAATNTQAGRQEQRCTSCDELLAEQVIPANPNITLDKTSLTLGAGTIFKLTAATEVETAVSWSSDDERIAAVSADGTVSAKEAGTAAITAKTAGGKTAVCTVIVKAAPVSVTLSQTALTLGQGEAYTLTAAIAPSSADGLPAEWSSGNADIASVDENGKVTANAAGTAVITFQTFNGVSVGCTVTVKDAPASVTLNQTALTLGVGESFALTAALNTGAASSKNTWSSGSAAIAAVDANGKVTAKAAGTAVITFETYNGKTKTCTVTVKAAPTSVTLNKTSLTLGKGESFTLTAALNPSGAASFKTTWSSSDTTIVTVDAKGKITAKAAGTATITFQAFNGKAKTCAVTVKNAPSSVALNKTSLTLGKGETFALTATPNSGAASSKNTWNSSDTKIAAVDANGKITAKAAGTATITVKTFNSKTKSCTVTVKAAPSSVTLSKTSLTLGKGETYTLKATLNSGAASAKNSWSSSDTKIATVDASGKITAKAAGTATITVKTFNSKTKSCKVTVKPAPSSVTLSKTSLTLGKGETFALKATLNSGAASAKNTWSSSDTKIATVDASGKITAKAVGTATITVKTFNGKTKSCKVTVKAAPTSVKLNKSTLTLAKGKAETLKVTLNPSGAASLKRTWTSSNTKIAKVDANGKVTAVAKGTATITCKTFNGKTKTCKVTVK